MSGALRTRRRRHASALALARLGLAFVALLLAGCSKVPAGTAGSSDDGNANAAHGQAVRFAQCMRDNGVRAFPDPNASGSFTIEDIANGSSIDTESPAFERAMTECRDLQPPGFTGAVRTPEQQKAALVFAQCIRDHGVKDFPDPEPDAPLVDTNRIPSSGTPGGMDRLNAAMGKCDASAAGVTDPR